GIRDRNVTGVQTCALPILIRLEGLPQKAQFEYLQNKLPTSQRCELDLATPRSSFGDAWLSSFLDVAQLIQSAEQLRQKYRHSGKIGRASCRESGEEW